MNERRMKTYREKQGSLYLYTFLSPGLGVRQIDREQAIEQTPFPLSSGRHAPLAGAATRRTRRPRDIVRAAAAAPANAAYASYSGFTGRRGRRAAAAADAPQNTSTAPAGTPTTDTDADAGAAVTRVVRARQRGLARRSHLLPTIQRRTVHKTSQIIILRKRVSIAAGEKSSDGGRP